MKTSHRIAIHASLVLLAIGACTPPESTRPAEQAMAPTGAANSPATPRSIRLAPLEQIRGIGFPKPAPQPPPTPEPFFVRGMYGRDSSGTGLQKIGAAGFNTVTVQPDRSDLDDLAAAGMKGIVWLFGYDDNTCSFNRSDDEIRSLVGRIAGHPAILVYQIDDEPGRARTEGCPRIASQIRDRSRLVKSIDREAMTFLVVSTYDGREEFPYQYFAGTTDVMGLDVYPYTENGAHPELIDHAIREADHDKVPRYWAILQDFSDDYYVEPSAAQIREQFRLWWASRMQGYLVYHWNRGAIESHPDHLDVYARENRRDPT